MKAVGFYLLEIYKQSVDRGYKYNYGKILHPIKEIRKIELNRGQLEYEFNLLQSRLKKRHPTKYLDNLKVKILEPHPLFTLRMGLPEPWEKSYWNQLIE
jgi:hypothetical protein